MNVSLPLPRKADVVAAAADHGVVAVAAQQMVGALAAGDGVVAGSAVDCETDEAGRQAGRVDRVVAAAGVDREAVAIGMVNVDLGGKPEHRHFGARSDDGDLVGLAGAVHRHLIDLAVSHAVHTELERDLASRRYRSDRRP